MIKTPKKHSDLTLGNLMTLNTIKEPLERVSSVCGIEPSELRKETLEAIQNASDMLDKVLAAETQQLELIITLEGIDYGLIPDWEAFTAGEWIDVEAYTDDFWNNANKLMSILYRPIVQRFGKTYSIKPYTAKEDHEVFKNMKAEHFNGCLLFFSTIRRKLLSITKSYLREMVKPLTSLAKTGDGIQYSTPSLEKTSSKSKASQTSPSEWFSHTSLS